MLVRSSHRDYLEYLLLLDFELIKVDLVHLGICQKTTVSKGIAGSITLPVKVDEALGISGCCSRELVIVGLADQKFTFSGAVRLDFFSFP